MFVHTDVDFIRENRSNTVASEVWLSKYLTVVGQSSCISFVFSIVGLSHPLFFSCSFVHTFTSIRLMYHTFIILDGRLCHQLLVCGYIVSLAVFVLSFVTLFFILSPGHFGENDPFCPSSARCLHPFLSQATCERALPLSHFNCRIVTPSFFFLFVCTHLY